MTKTKFFLFITLIFISSKLFSQVRISGQVVNQNNKPVEFMEVYLQNIDSTIIKSELTTADGKFTIITEKGEYLLFLVQVGLTIYKQKINPNQDLNFGIIPIIERSEQLNEVVVTSKKRLIEKKSDRIIYNVQSSVFANGVSGDELLKNLPRIDPTSDGLKIIGKSNVLLMVDDRLLNITGEDLKNYLKTLRSENIDKIEIITSPSSKYDASGNSGLINIKLKKKTNLGFDGNISTTFIQKTKPSINNSINLNYSTDKLILGYSIFYGNENRFSNYKNDYFFENESRKSIEKTERKNKGLSHNFNIDYQINKKITTGLYLNYGDWDNASYRSSKVSFFNNNDIIFRSQDSPANTISDYKGLSVSPYLDIKLDSIGSKL